MKEQKKNENENKDKKVFYLNVYQSVIYTTLFAPKARLV